MNPKQREMIRHSLLTIVKSYTSMIEVMENTLALLCEELSIDHISLLRKTIANNGRRAPSSHLLTNNSLLTVTYRGKTCFLGNTLSFRLLQHLEQRPNAYFSYEDLLSHVWHSHRSDAAIRSVVKILRHKLKSAGLAELANAIDGSVSGHYSLKIDSKL